MNKKIFFDVIRPQVNLTTQNVLGFNKVLDYAMARGTPINDLAYALATAFWATAQTMTPIVEAYWMSEYPLNCNINKVPS